VTLKAGEAALQQMQFANLMLMSLPPDSVDVQGLWQQR
jgi:hypothetical protein